MTHTLNAVVLADHLSSSDLTAGRVLAVLLPLLMAGAAGVIADAVLPYGQLLARRRRGVAVAVAAGVALLAAALVLPGYDGLADWIG